MMMRARTVFWLGLALLVLDGSPLQACTSCFGQSDSRMAQGMNMGIAVLLAVITTVLCGVAGFFYYVARRNENIEAQQQLAHYPQN